MKRFASLFLRDAPHPGAAGWGLAILRIAVPLILLFGHGLPKLMGWPRMSTQFPDILGIGSAGNLALVVFAEFVCAGLVALGIATRLFAIPVVINFSVAVIIGHAGDPFARRELPLLFGIVFLILAFAGGGRLALGRALFRRQ